MVEQTLITKLREILTDLEKKGGAYLFAILKMDDITDRWTAVFSASWVTALNRGEAFATLRGYILSKLSPEELSTFARIAIFLKDDHFVDLMLEKYRTDDYINSDEKINGNLVHEGYILLASKPTKVA